MAAPGEWFPQNFASTILQVSENRRREAAQLAEMRNQRAADNFLQEERLRLSSVQGQQSQINEEARAEIAKLQAQTEAERVKLERDATVARSVAEFGKTGFAFIPTHAADQIPKLMSAFGGGDGDADTGGTVVEESVGEGSVPGSSTRTTGSAKTIRSARAPGAPTVTTVELPGYGTILQRIGGPGFEKQAADLAKVEALTEKYKQDGILAHKRGEAAQLSAFEKASRISNMEGKLSLESLRLANNVREGLRKQGEEMLTTLRIQAPDKLTEADRERIRKSTEDLSYIFPEGSEEARNWDLVTDIIESGLSAQKKGISLPQKTDVKTMEALGVDKLLFGDLASGLAAKPAQAEQTARVVGRVLLDGQNYFVTADRQLIPTNDTKTPLSLVGGAPPSAAPAAAVSAAASPPSPPTATPEQQQAAKDLMSRWKAAPPGSAEKEALRKQIVELKSAMQSR